MSHLRQLAIVLFILPVLVAIPQRAFSGDNNILWDHLYHNDPANYDPTTETVPFETFTFREVEPGGAVLPTTDVNIYILVDHFDLTSANVVFSTGGADTWVPMSFVKNITTSFHGQPSRTYDLWKGTIPAQPAGTTVYYRIQVNDGTASAYLKSDNTAGGGYLNPLGQWVRNPDAPATDNYSYFVDDLIPVELTTFAASTTAEGVRLSWSTATETENLGFHVYRSQAAEGDYAQISAQMIPGQGNSSEQNNYEFIDKGVEIGTTYFYKLADIDYNGELTMHGPVSVTVSPMPTEFVLEQNFPNPFNPATTINFALPEANEVTLAIYTTTGQLVRTLVRGQVSAGNHSVSWNALDDSGARVASGVYLYTLKTSSGVLQKKKLILMK